MKDGLFTRREVTLAERAAWKAGVDWVLHHFGTAMLDASWDAARRESATAVLNAYPLPKITRPRVVADHQYEWRVGDDGLEYRYIGKPNYGWHSAKQLGFLLSAERISALATLLSDPTETVSE